MASFTVGYSRFTAWARIWLVVWRYWFLNSGFSKVYCFSSMITSKTKHPRAQSAQGCRNCTVPPCGFSQSTAVTGGSRPGSLPGRSGVVRTRRRRRTLPASGVPLCPWQNQSALPHRSLNSASLASPRGNVNHLPAFPSPHIKTPGLHSAPGSIICQNSGGIIPPPGPWPPQ